MSTNQMLDWQPIATAPADIALAVVAWKDAGEWRYDFERREEGCWVQHADDREHYLAIGGAGVFVAGPPEDAPYTHWRAIAPPENAA